MTLRSGIVWLVLAVAAGTTLFVVKHEVQNLEGRLAVLDHQVQKDRTEIHVLHAEWAYLTRPDRLADLVRNHLDLVPPRPDQIVGSIDRIPMAPAKDETGGVSSGPFRPLTPARFAP